MGAWIRIRRNRPAAGPDTPVMPIEPVLTAAWPVADPLSLSLWLGAIASVATRLPAHLDHELGALAEICLALWPARIRA
jgi:hypothetical protein